LSNAMPLCMFIFLIEIVGHAYRVARRSNDFVGDSQIFSV